MGSQSGSGGKCWPVAVGTETQGTSRALDGQWDSTLEATCGGDSWSHVAAMTSRHPCGNPNREAGDESQARRKHGIEDHMQRMSREVVNTDKMNWKTEKVST